MASTEYPNKVSIASTTPYITDAYEVTAELTANEGTAASPYEVYVKVPETVTEIKKNNIGIMSEQYELYEDENFTEKVLDESWQVSWDAENRGVVYAWAKDLLGEKYYIITIQRDPADTP
ncbi:MAG: hypothetical protein GX581_11265 [Syntrophomonadaceae bacterium]|nr:hypothetical protein [Syntrophomonadaceae bacterium]